GPTCSLFGIWTIAVESRTSNIGPIERLLLFDPARALAESRVCLPNAANVRHARHPIPDHEAGKALRRRAKTRCQSQTRRPVKLQREQHLPLPLEWRCVLEDARIAVRRVYVAHSRTRPR